MDIALAVDAEKLKDAGYGGLPTPFRGNLNDLWLPSMATPARFAQLGEGYAVSMALIKPIKNAPWRMFRGRVIRTARAARRLTYASR